METNKLYELIESKNYIQLKKELEEMRAVDIAELFEPLDLHTSLLLFRMLPKDLAIEVFSSLSPEQQEDFISIITDKELQDIVDELFFDDMIDMLEEMPATVVNKVLQHTDEERRNLINKFLKYPADSAGSLMTIEYVELRKKSTVGQALRHIKETGLDKETVYTCYVIDENRILEGIVSLRKLVISDEDLKIEDIMDKDVVYVNTRDDQEEVADIFKKYGFLALPVVDREDRLTGIITFDDIMDVMDQETTEDFQKMAAMSPSEDPYLEASVFGLAKQRIIWLLFLMISATFTSRIIRGYEEVLQAAIVLNAFVPMLMDTGGNSGSQSSTLIIRGLALGDIEPKDAGKVVWKEFRVSLIVGLVLAVVNFIRIYTFDTVGPMIALTISITLFVTVVIAKVVGGMLPILAKKLKMDPAIMAGPLITTIVDALALMVYFSVAQTLLGIG